MNYKMPSHDIFQKPGDEGSFSQGAELDDPTKDVPSPAPGVMQKPGQEGSSGLAVNDPGYQMGCGSNPGASLSDFQKGPEVRKTRVEAASNSNPTPEMPGA